MTVRDLDLPGRVAGRAGGRAPTRLRLLARAVARSPAGRRPAAVAAGTALVALGVGVDAITRVDPSRIGAIGLVGALPPSYFVALGLALVSFVVVVHQPRPSDLAAGWSVVVLIVLLLGADPIVHGLPRLEASYRHLGIIDLIGTTGRLFPGLDAYFDWPGFFAGAAMFRAATGASTATMLRIATWAPVGVDILLVVPLLTLARYLTGDRRRAWLAVWFFFLASWIGQDYFSPQAYAFILLVVLFGATVGALAGAAGRHRAPGRLRRLLGVAWAAPRGDSARPGPATLVVLAALLLLAITAVHQLTPFAAALVLCAVGVAGGHRLRWVPVLSVLLPLCWLVIVAAPYLSGHLPDLLSSALAVGANGSASVGRRVAGSAGHRVVVDLRLVESALVWAGAAAGVLVARRRRRPWSAAALGVLAPLLLIGADSYGGEVALRAYWYGLPFAACLLAEAVAAGPAGPHRWRRATAVLVAGTALAGTTLFTRYGDDAMDNFTPAEIALAEQTYATVPPGSTLVEAVHDTAWQFVHYADYRYVALLPAAARPTAAALSCRAVEQLAVHSQVWVLVTRSQEQAARLLGVGPPGDVQRFVATCAAAPGWTVVARSPGGTLLRVRAVPPQPTGRGAPWTGPAR